MTEAPENDGCERREQRACAHAAPASVGGSGSVCRSRESRPPSTAQMKHEPTTVQLQFTSENASTLRLARELQNSRVQLAIRSIGAMPLALLRPPRAGA